jgi:1-acyl-sn-glycerol-3-phosphate acyltransferase
VIKRGNMGSNKEGSGERHYPIIGALCRLYIRISGWHLVGKFPETDKYIVIFVNHTSNWDFLPLIAMRYVKRIYASWFGKHTLFKWPLGAILSSMGGIPINRQKSSNMVNQAIDIFNQRDSYVLLIAPEGTRKQVTHWKTGFYYISLGAGVPICPVVLDYRLKQLVIGDPFYPTGDIEKDIKSLQSCYDNHTAKRPEYVFNGEDH